MASKNKKAGKKPDARVDVSSRVHSDPVHKLQREPTPTTREPFESPIPKWVWVLTAVALLLRAPFAATWGLWLDELYVRGKVLGPVGDYLRTLHFVHFLAVKPFVSVADNRLFLRIPSVLFGTASVPLGFLAARRMFGEATALVYACFICCGTYFINYSIDANYYGHMMFWIVAALYFYARLFSTHRFRNLVALAGVVPISFFVHPFSGLFFAAFSVFLAADLIATPGYFERLPMFDLFFKTRARRAGAFAALLGIMGIGLLVMSGEGDIGRVFQGTVNNFLTMLAFGKSPLNIQFSYLFFEQYFAQAGPAFYKTFGPVAATGTIFVFALFLYGVYLSFRRDALFPLLFLFPFILSFTLIFNLDAKRFFNNRYFSYLVPLYWMPISMAVVDLAGRAAEIPIAKAKTNFRACLAVAVLAVLSLSLPQYSFILFSDLRNWDKVMPQIAQRIQDQEPVLFTNWAEDTIVPYHLKKYGLESHPVRRLKYTEGRDKFAQSELQDACFRIPRLWFVSTWLDIYSKNALDWAKLRMETVAVGPSAFTRTNDVTAFHWDWGGRYVLPPRILSFRSKDEKIVSQSSFEERFLFEKGMDYEIRVHPTTPIPDPTIRLKIQSGETKSIEMRKNPEKDYFQAATEIGEGVQTLEFSRAEGPIQIGDIEIIPRFPEGKILIAASEPYDVHPSLFTLTPKEGNAYVLQFKRSTFADYQFGVAEAGKYRVTCEARHDGNAQAQPIWLELRMDDEVAGVLEFSSNEYQERGFPLINLVLGNHRLMARFLNERVLAGKNDPTLDREAWVRRFEIKPITETDGTTDQRIFAPSSPPKPIRLVAPGDAKFAEGWLPYSKDDVKAHIEKVEGIDGFAFNATLSRESEGVILVSPPQPIPPSGLVYYSALLKVENLANHSANLRTRVLDRGGAPLAEIIVDQEGINGTTDWIRFVDFRKLPPQAAFFQAMFWVYPNGTRPSPEAGKVWFRGLQIEATR